MLARVKMRATKRADAVVTVSEHTLADLHRLHPWTRDKRCLVIPNGVDREFRKTERRSLISVAGHRLDADGFLLYVGHRGHCKNFPGAVEIFQILSRRFSQLKLVLVGGGSLSRRERVWLAVNSSNVVDSGRPSDGWFVM